MNENLEYMIKHPIKTIVLTGAGTILLINITKAQTNPNDCWLKSCQYARGVYSLS
jgi:hypothetical protein